MIHENYDPETGVELGDLFWVKYPVFPQNYKKVGRVIGRVVPKPEFKHKFPTDEVMWVCEFPEPITTSLGLLTLGSLKNSQLVKIVGRTLTVRQNKKKEELIC